MSALRSILKELASLFVDDQFLAAGLLAVVAASWFLQTNGAGSAVSGAVLLLGSLAVLVVSVLSERRK
jgi:HD-like signal output (HDOD) protein